VRIGIAISRYARSGGLERVSGEWARGLASRGHEVTVFAQQVEEGPGDDAVRFVHVGGMHSPIAARAATYPFAVTRAIREASPDVVIAFGNAVLLPDVIVRLHGAHRPWWELANSLAPWDSYEGARRRLNPHHRIVLALEKRILTPRIARAVLAASDQAAADIRRLYPAIADRVRVVPDGIDLDAFHFDPTAREATRRAWRADDSFVVLTVATEVRRKGIATLLDAFVLFSSERPDAVLVVAGSAPRAEIERLAAARGISDRVRMPGFVPDIAAAYGAADLFVFPTIFDPWGLPVVEALACGTPVVTSKAAGSSQVIVPSENGLLTEQFADAASIAAAMREASGIAAGRERIRSSVAHLSWPRVIDDVDSLLIQG